MSSLGDPTIGVADQIEIWKKFFLSLPWQNLVPDQDRSLLIGGNGTYSDVDTRVSVSDYATAAKTLDGSTAVIYMSTARTITVNMANLRGAARAQWFDPSSGDYRDAAGSPIPDSGSHAFTPPGENHAGDSDWVLLLQYAQ